MGTLFPAEIQTLHSCRCWRDLALGIGRKLTLLLLHLTLNISIFPTSMPLNRGLAVLNFDSHCSKYIHNCSVSGSFKTINVLGTRRLSLLFLERKECRCNQPPAFSESHRREAVRLWGRLVAQPASFGSTPWSSYIIARAAPTTSQRYAINLCLLLQTFESYSCH